MATAAPTTRSLRCVVVTPERAVLDEAVDFVAVPMVDGELGVERGRLPMIGRLGFGELRLRRGRGIRRYYVDGGFVQVRADVVTVLTARAVAGSALKVEAARETLERSHGIATTVEAQESHLRDQARARAQLRIAAKSSEAESAEAVQQFIEEARAR
jgi:F-type H+-transporting ATPase subunit epsilon